MKKLARTGIGLTLLLSLVACGNAETVEDTSSTVDTDTMDLTSETVEVKDDREYGLLVGFDEDGIKGEHKTPLEIEMLSMLQDDVNVTVLDSSTNTMYMFSDNDSWTEFLMGELKGVNLAGDMDELIRGYEGLAEILAPDYDLVVSNPTNTLRALLYYKDGELVYNAFEEQ